MFGLVEAWGQSEQTQQAFCLSHDLKVATFSYWCRKYREAQQQAEGHFEELIFSEPGHYTLTYPNGVQLSLPAGSDLSTLHQLICLV